MCHVFVYVFSVVYVSLGSLCVCFLCVSCSWVCHVFVRMLYVSTMCGEGRLWVCQVFVLCCMCHEGRLWGFRVFFGIVGMSCVCAYVS